MIFGRAKLAEALTADENLSMRLIFASRRGPLLRSRRRLANCRTEQILPI